jgi:hypothetical protein
MTPLLVLPLPLILLTSAAAGVYALLTRRSAPRLERKQLSTKAEASQRNANVTAVAAARA